MEPTWLDRILDLFLTNQVKIVKIYTYCQKLQTMKSLLNAILIQVIIGNNQGYYIPSKRQTWEK